MKQRNLLLEAAFPQSAKTKIAAKAKAIADREKNLSVQRDVAKQEYQDRITITKQFGPDFTARQDYPSGVFDASTEVIPASTLSNVSARDQRDSALSGMQDVLSNETSLSTRTRSA